MEQKKQYTDKKLKEAENRLPKRNVLKFEKSFDCEKGKCTAKLTVNKEVVPFNKKDSIIKSGVKKGAAAVGGAAALSFHREIQKYEDDNSALKAAHGAEKISEKAVRSGVRAVKTASVKMREEPYKRVSKLKFQSEKADSRLTYSKNKDTVKTVQSSKEAARKAMMKQNTKKAQKTAGKTGKSAKDILGRIGKKAASLIASNKVVIIVVIIILLILVIFFGVAFIFVTIFSESGGAVISSTYMSEDEAMLNAESYMTSLEDDLQLQIDNIPNDYSGYDEYRYNLDEIGHDPYALISFLSAKNIVFEYNEELQADITALFYALYTIELTSFRETRSYTVTEIDPQGNPYEVTVYYYYYILEVTLIVNDFDETVSEFLNNPDEYGLYELLQETQGNKPDLFS